MSTSEKLQEKAVNAINADTEAKLVSIYKGFEIRRREIQAALTDLDAKKICFSSLVDMGELDTAIKEYQGYGRDFHKGQDY